MKLILDTDVFIDILRGLSAAENWLTGLPSTPYISGVAVLEVSFGARSSSDSTFIEQTIAKFPVVWPTDADVRRATVEFGRLRLAYGIGALDAVAAASRFDRECRSPHLM